MRQLLLLQQQSTIENTSDYDDITDGDKSAYLQSNLHFMSCNFAMSAEKLLLSIPQGCCRFVSFQVKIIYFLNNFEINVCLFYQCISSYSFGQVS